MNALESEKIYEVLTLEEIGHQASDRLSDQRIFSKLEAALQLQGHPCQ